MPKVPRDVSEIVDRVIEEHPDHPARGLARIVVERTGGAVTLDQARNRIRYRFGQSGARDRRKGRPRRYSRPARKPGRMVEMPKSQAAAWTPATLDVVGRVGILSDIHVPYHSETAVEAAVGFLRGQSLAAIVLNGDIADFYSISRWTKNPAMRNLRGELAAVRQLLAWVREQFPDVPIIYKIGNHEERWDHWLWQHAPEISDDPKMGLENWFGLADLEIELVGDHRPVMLGLLPVLHGHEKGKGISAPVNQARGAFLRLQHTAIEGHGHRTSAHCEPDMFGREVFCWSTGCLCDLRPEYARLNKWNHGFALVDVRADGTFDVQNLRVAPGGEVRLS